LLICAPFASYFGYQLAEQRGVSPVKGSIQDGTDAVITPATT